MKLHTKIISLLLVAGLASAGAQSAGSSASNFYVKGSVGYLDSDFDDVSNLNSIAGISAKSDKSEVWSFEAGMHVGNNWSLGLEYSFFGADASLKAANLSQAQTDALNALFGLIGSVPNFGSGYDAYTSTDAKVNSFMFIFNYEYFLNNQFSVLIKSGLGLFDVEQTLKVSRDVDGAGPTLPESLINSSKSDTALAYQLGINMNYYVTEAIALSAGVRYLDSSDLEFKHGTLKVTEDDTGSIVYDFGLTYSF